MLNAEPLQYYEPEEYIGHQGDAGAGILEDNSQPIQSTSPIESPRGDEEPEVVFASRQSQTSDLEADPLPISPLGC